MRQIVPNYVMGGAVALLAWLLYMVVRASAVQPITWKTLCDSWRMQPKEVKIISVGWLTFFVGFVYHVWASYDKSDKR